MRKSKGTFIVKIDDCQNDTWQGRVVWADKEKTEHFRSTLELIRMIDGAVNMGQMGSKEREGTA